MIWNILEIEKTKDKEAIKKAYRNKLLSVNPEDKPEEFKALRDAYEEALAFADQEEEKEMDETPQGRWTFELSAMYSDFSRRIDPAEWRKLFSDDFCMGLGTKPVAEEKMIEFILEHFYIPHKVWLVIDEFFSFSERREELYEKWPQDFVDYVIMGGIKTDDDFGYYSFTNGNNAETCDLYQQLYHQARRMDLKEAGDIIDRIRSLDESHPLGKLLEYQYMMTQGQAEEGAEAIESLYEEYPDEKIVCITHAANCIIQERFIDAEKAAAHALELDDKNMSAKRALCDALSGQGRFEDAKKHLYEIMDVAATDTIWQEELAGVLRGINDREIPVLEAKIAEEPEDSETRMQLAWAYLQTDRLSEAENLCNSIEYYEDEYELYNIKAKIAYSLDKLEEALEYQKKKIELLKASVDDGTEKMRKRIEALGNSYQLLGSCHLRLGNREEGIEAFEQSMKASPENMEVLFRMVSLMMEERNYDRAVDIMEHIVAMNPYSYTAFNQLADIYFIMGRDRDAFDAVNRSLDIEERDLGTYILKIRILIRNGVYDEAHAILDYLVENGVPDGAPLWMCQALLAEYEEDDSSKALTLYEKVAESIEAGEYLPNRPEIYFRIVCIRGAETDMSDEMSVNGLMELLDKGLSYDENDMDCLDYKAWIYKVTGNREKAIETYGKMMSLRNHPVSVEEGLGEIYYDELETNPEKPLSMFERALERRENPVSRFYAGTCRRYMADFDGAVEHFMKEMEYDPEDVDGYRGAGYSYEAMKKYEEAVSCMDKASRIAEKRGQNDNVISYELRKIQIFRRMNRPQDAMEILNRLHDEYDYEDYYSDMYDVLCQFGMWDKLDMLFIEWEKNNGKSGELYKGLILSRLLRGEEKKAEKYFGKYKKYLDDNDCEEVELTFLELYGDHEKAAEIWYERSQQRKNNDHELLNYAEHCRYAGDEEKAREYAALALEKIDERLEYERRDEALYRTRRSMVLALLGRIEEARIDLEKAKSLHLCDFCVYESCKDADIFEAVIEEIRGNFEQAKELYRKGMVNWPDDSDFISGLRRMERKGI